MYCSARSIWGRYPSLIGAEHSATGNGCSAILAARATGYLLVDRGAWSILPTSAFHHSPMRGELVSTQTLGDPTVDSGRPSVTTYAVVSGALTGVGIVCWLITAQHAGVAADARAVIAPMASLVALTGVVWLAMVLVRNLTVMRGITSARYFIDYASAKPADWVERPARTFNNLLQLPMLFYVVCLAILITHECDRAQLLLAWLFVALRVVHGTIYIGWNHVPTRFAAWASGSIALGVLWWRFAAQSWPGLLL
jgi:hypothetical protein